MKAPKTLLVVLALFAAAAVRAGEPAELSRAVMLQATDRLGGSPFEETVLVAAPLEQGGHLGFIVNHPTDMKLEELFPDHAPSRKVVRPLYVGGPVLSQAVFALARKAPQGAGTVIPLMPGVVAVLDGTGVDQVIEATPNEARYFLGLVLWRPGELAEQVDAGDWRVQSASADGVFNQR